VQRQSTNIARWRQARCYRNDTTTRRQHSAAAKRQNEPPHRTQRASAISQRGAIKRIAPTKTPRALSSTKPPINRINMMRLLRSSSVRIMYLFCSNYPIPAVGIVNNLLARCAADTSELSAPGLAGTGAWTPCERSIAWQRSPRLNRDANFAGTRRLREKSVWRAKPAKKRDKRNRTKATMKTNGWTGGPQTAPRSACAFASERRRNSNHGARQRHTE
jgi:hypothetical protein